MPCRDHSPELWGPLGVNTLLCCPDTWVPCPVTVTAPDAGSCGAPRGEHPAQPPRHLGPVPRHSHCPRGWELQGPLGVSASRELTGCPRPRFRVVLAGGQRGAVAALPCRYLPGAGGCAARQRGAQPRGDVQPDPLHIGHGPDDPDQRQNRIPAPDGTEGVRCCG